MGAQTGHQCQRHVDEGRQHRKPQDATCSFLARRRGVNMHILSLCAQSSKGQRLRELLFLHTRGRFGTLFGLAWPNDLRMRNPHHRDTVAKAAPALGDQNAVFGAPGLVANGTGHSDLDLRGVENRGQR